MAIRSTNLQSPSEPTLGNGIYCTLSELFNEGLKSGKNHLHLRRKAMAQKGGQKRSSIRGRGMEFFESRPYVVEDEVRHIDWKVSARLNGIYTKIFIEEKDRPIYLVVDLRSHMFFASRQYFKSVLAAKIAARLSFAAINGGDTVGGFIFTTNSHREIPAQSSKNGLARLFGELAQITQAPHRKDEESSPKLWSAVFSQIKQRIHKGCAVFLLSDFYGLDMTCHNSLYALRKKADIFALKITDPLEQELPALGAVGIAFGDKKISFNSSDDLLRKNFARALENQAKIENELFYALNIPKFDFSTSDNLNITLRPLFAGKW